MVRPFCELNSAFHNQIVKVTLGETTELQMFHFAFFFLGRESILDLTICSTKEVNKGGCISFCLLLYEGTL